MNIKHSQLSKPNVRLTEAEAFFNGAQGVAIENALAETAAGFEALKAQTEKAAADQIKRLESEIEISRERLAEAEARRKFWHDLTGGIAPHFFKFVGFIFAGFLMLLGETALLQRIADVFGVAEPLWQFVLVGVIVLLLATLCDSVVWFWKSSYNRIAVGVYGTVVLFGLIALGVFRAFVLEIVEADGDAVLLRLYDETYFLNKLVMIFLTAGLPIGATFAFEYGWFGLNRRQQWQQAWRDALKFKKLHETAVKKHEAETEKLAKRLVELDEIRLSWQSAQNQAHAEGSRTGAARRPLWEIVPLLAGASLLIVFAVMLAVYWFFDVFLAEAIESDAARFALYLILSGGLISLFAYRVLRRWNSPSPAQFYADRRLRREPESALQIEAKRILPSARLEKTNGKFAEIN